ncbi:LIM domain-containing protein [Alkalibacillus haloalkaliphilus]|uniref:Permease n=1 Tax=Alkalibacillus haloalkaliphilus TaxID=94136 RepID=A0A511WCZ0_9BACI|nr:hypothetical protein [Alkalibacillus haloalkaliphilus]GEN47132.1 hypothetical protein AHA02nite_29080 [Alkalibacillus haloalkaliphilus]
MNMGKKAVVCNRCNKEITDRNDLMTGNVKMTVRPFHEKCFKKRVEEKKERASMFFDAMPFNGRYANIMTVIFLLLFVAFLTFIEVPGIALVLVLIYPIYRFISWIAIELRLPSKS